MILSQPARTFGKILLTVSLCLFCLVQSGCKEEKQNLFQGYVEGEYLLVSSPIGGKLEKLFVSRGMTLTKSTPLFSLDQTFEAAAVAEAEQGLLSAANRLADISKGLRPSEIDAIKAKREQAKAAYDLARIEYERREQLLQQKVIAKEVLDRTRTEMKRNYAALAQLDAELETAGLGARTDEIEAARTEVEAARERLAQARWSLEQKKQIAPLDSLVFDTFYVEGEYVPAAYPVVSLLPPGNVMIRFFVPETLVGSLKPTQTVSVSFDGSKKTYRAEISFISPQPEYTPPVIYSRESRSHLVFMIEARVNKKDAISLNPGQPVDVLLE